jgi:hypothetical protein
MRNTLKAVLTAAALVTGLAAATTVFAEGQPNPAGLPAATEPAAPGMMQGDGMMKMMTRMSEMMESCNKMMQAKAQQPDHVTEPGRHGG